jgi:pathogenesis-related protein 1
MSRFALALAGTLVALTIATPSHATLDACSARKQLCVSRRAAGLLKCHQQAQAKGLDPVSDPTVQACLQKVVTKFDGGATPSKGCFARLEARFPGGCLTSGDTAALADTVDAFVGSAVTALDPGYPAPVTNACSAGKTKCVSKKATALLACHSENETPPAGLSATTFAACLQSAREGFDGGADPTQSCFAKLETQFPDCLTTLDTAALETTVDGYVNDVVCQLDAGSGTCPFATPTATPTPVPPTPTATPTPSVCSETVPASWTSNVSAHNNARANALPVPNPALDPLCWKATVASTAQGWADGCNFIHNPGRGFLGENIYACAGSGCATNATMDSITSWASEAADYDYASNTCSGVCGHYTQIVWRDTTHVGCGVTNCTTNSPFGGFPNWTMVVCDYEPPGNFIGQRPY